MATKRSLVGKITRDLEASFISEIALSAILPFKKQKDVTEFVNFVLDCLDRNSNWLNSVINRQKKFKCVLMMGSGPGRFQMKDTIYPRDDDDGFKLEVELKGSADYDKIAIAALVVLNQHDIETLTKFLDTSCKCENGLIREDLLKGRAMGVTYAIMQPVADGQYRIIQTVVVDRPVRSMRAIKAIKEQKALRDMKKREMMLMLSEPPVKKTRKVK